MRRDRAHPADVRRSRGLHGTSLLSACRRSPRARLSKTRRRTVRVARRGGSHNSYYAIRPPGHGACRELPYARPARRKPRARASLDITKLCLLARCACATDACPPRQDGVTRAASLRDEHVRIVAAPAPPTARGNASARRFVDDARR